MMKNTKIDIFIGQYQTDTVSYGSHEAMHWKSTSQIFEFGSLVREAFSKTN